MNGEIMHFEKEFISLIDKELERLHTLVNSNTEDKKWAMSRIEEIYEVLLKEPQYFIPEDAQRMRVPF